MLISYDCKLKNSHLFPISVSMFGLSNICSRSLLSYPKPINCDSIHSLVQTNPLLSLLEKCKSMIQLKQIQAQMTLTGLIYDSFAASRLIVFCALSELRDLDYCKKILYKAHSANVFSWNVAIRGYLESGNPKESILLYKRMLQYYRLRPDNHTYPSLLRACSCPSLNFVGFAILGHVFKFGFAIDIFVHNALLYMLLSYGEVEVAYYVFDKGCVRDLVSWNSMINGCVRRGLANEALKLYQQMVVEKVKPDEITMVGVVSSCAQLQDLKLGNFFHQYIEQHGLDLTISLTNALMDMYVKCGDIMAARILFDNMAQKTIASWTTMVLGYASLGLLGVAREILYKIPEKCVVPWNAIISGCVQAKRSKEALTLFHEMQVNNITPDEVTMVNCLSACSLLGALDIGVWIHHYIERHSLSLNVALGTSLVDMYAKCGNIARALQVFHSMPQRNCLTWTAIICGLAFNGNAYDAISYFSEMVCTGLMPDEITFLGVLSACSHRGLIEEGRKYFAQMRSKYNISPQLKHYACMVDLLGRAGLLEEAQELIKNMPMIADAGVWGALFFACHVHRNILIGEKAALKLLELEPQDSGIYVLLANMYGEAKMWKEVKSIRKTMKERGIEKTPGCSSIKVNGIVHEFVARDTSHPQCEWICQCLVALTREMELLGLASHVIV